MGASLPPLDSKIAHWTVIERLQCVTVHPAVACFEKLTKSAILVGFSPN